MPGGTEIQTHLYGAWRMMMGRSDGLAMMEISADGFWRSFFAIVVAAPALLVGWVALADDPSYGPAELGRIGLVLRLAAIDAVTWVLPIVVLALVAPAAGIGDRFAHYVIASNWGSALLIWLLLPAALARLLLPQAGDATNLLSLVFFLASLFLSWRLTNVAIGRGPAVASAVFFGMFALSLLVLAAMQALLGLPGADQISG